MNPEKSKVQHNFETEAEPFAKSSASLHKSEVTVSREGRERTINLVVKQFETAEAAQNSLETYQRLREIGISILPATYRLVPDTPDQVAVTDYTKNEQMAVAINQSVEFTSGALNSVDMKHFTDTLGKLGNTAKLLAKHRVAVPADAYFAILPELGGDDAKLNVVLGDIEGITVDAADEYDPAANIFPMQLFLLSAVVGNLTDSEQKSALGTLISEWGQNLRQSVSAE